MLYALLGVDANRWYLRNNNLSMTIPFAVIRASALTGGDRSSPLRRISTGTGEQSMGPDDAPGGPEIARRAGGSNIDIDQDTAMFAVMPF